MPPTGIQRLRQTWGRIRRRFGRATARGRLRDFESDAAQQNKLYGAPNRRSLGVRTVDVRRILGSVGRSLEFDETFHARRWSNANTQRSTRVKAALDGGAPLPPLELYKLGRNYYVLDGHHRVGAARDLGIEALEAEVTLFIPSGDPEALRLFQERRAFEQATGLQSIGGERPATYRRLLTEIHAFRRELADERGAAVDLVEAARVWYARVFLPVFAAIRGADLQSWYPALRHADMVAALFEEQREMRQRREHAAEQVAVGGDEQG